MAAQNILEWTSWATQVYFVRPLGRTFLYNLTFLASKSSRKLDQMEHSDSPCVVDMGIIFRETG